MVLAQRIVVDAHCDVCLDEYDKRTPGDTYTILHKGPDGNVCLEGELCASHNSLARQWEYLRRYGRTIADYVFKVSRPEGTGGRATHSVSLAAEKAGATLTRVTAKKALSAGSPNGIRINCGEQGCPWEGFLASRSSHAKEVHKKKVWEVEWIFPEEAKTHSCKCGLVLPVEMSIPRHQGQSRCPAYTQRA